MEDRNSHLRAHRRFFKHPRMRPTRRHASFGSWVTNAEEMYPSSTPTPHHRPRERERERERLPKPVPSSSSFERTLKALSARSPRRPGCSADSSAAFALSDTSKTCSADRIRRLRCTRERCRATSSSASAARRVAFFLKLPPPPKVRSSPELSTADEGVDIQRRGGKGRGGGKKEKKKNYGCSVFHQTPF